MKYNNKIENVWNAAKYCDCNDYDCHINNHRICGICDNTILYGAHESVESQKNSCFRWNIDHISPGFKNGIENMQAAHVSCNQSKGNNFPHRKIFI